MQKIRMKELHLMNERSLWLNTDDGVEGDVACVFLQLWAFLALWTLRENKLLRFFSIAQVLKAVFTVSKLQLSSVL